jgi:hypothetical protein
MRLDVTITEMNRDVPGSGGWFRSKEMRKEWDVETRLELSQEERAIVQTRGLWRRTFYLRDFSYEDKERFASESGYDVAEDRMDVYLEELVNGMQGRNRICGPCATFYSPTEAKAYEKHLAEKVLPQIKALIEGSAEPGTGKRSYEA